MSEQGDLRLMTVYGYARLVAYNSSLELQPDILLSYENDKNRVFTLHLRPGHKWSDGTPFTAEDFRFHWEDILTDKDMDRGGLDAALLAGGKGPKFEVIDELTVRYTWDSPIRSSCRRLRVRVRSISTAPPHISSSSTPNTPTPRSLPPQLRRKR